ncbi:MAG: biopolymer transporter ExbD [Balneolaceae bacterium]
MFKNKRSREMGEINGSSLADIAFLLLIFFLVVTTIDIDTGIGLVLPPIPDDIEPPPVHERNMMRILVNASGMIQMDDDPVSVVEVKQRVKDFIDNPTNDVNLAESPQDAIVSIKTDRATEYNIYIDMLDEVTGAYNELRDAASQAQFGVPYSSLDDDSEQQDLIREQYPKQLSIAEPDEG